MSLAKILLVLETSRAPQKCVALVYFSLHWDLGHSPGVTHSGRMNPLREMVTEHKMARLARMPGAVAQCSHFSSFVLFSFEHSRHLQVSFYFHCLPKCTLLQCCVDLGIIPEHAYLAQSLGRTHWQDTQTCARVVTDQVIINIPTGAWRG